MEAREIQDTIDERLELVEQLHELTDQQAIAIQDGAMSDLMQLLSRKQVLIQRVLDSTASLRQLLQEPFGIRWTDSESEAEYRRRHRLCESMLADLLEREAESEHLLSARRDSVAKELQELGRAHNVAHRYESVSATSSGTSIDLSSEK